MGEGREDNRKIAAPGRVYSGGYTVVGIQWWVYAIQGIQGAQSAKSAIENAFKTADAQIYNFCTV